MFHEIRPAALPRPSRSHQTLSFHILRRPCIPTPFLSHRCKIRGGGAIPPLFLLPNSSRHVFHTSFALSPVISTLTKKHPGWVPPEDSHYGTPITAASFALVNAPPSLSCRLGALAKARHSPAAASPKGGIDFRLSTFDFRLSTFDFRLSTFDFRLSTILVLGNFFQLQYLRRLPALAAQRLP